jgi:polyisoprenoid-binding protein YceI
VKVRSIFVLTAAATMCLPLLGASADSVSVGPVLQDGRIRLKLAPEGNEARYRVNEQLARLTLPTDAVGATSAIQGGIVLERDGKIVADSSHITIDLTTLKSDSDRRDGFVKRNTFQTDQFPNAVIALRELRGIKFPLPTSGTASFQLVGDVTVHGVTKPTLWNVTATFAGNKVTGSAKTAVKFGDFNMTIPKVGSVLSVQDSIRLEYDFSFVR